MGHLADDCFAFAGGPLRIEQALAELKGRLDTLAEAETVPLGEAVGRILAEDMAAERAVPPHASAAVDGYAVYFDDLDRLLPTRLPITGRIAAGHPLGRPARRGEALRVYAGAPLPDGPDTVLAQEDCPTDGEGRQSEHVLIPPATARGANFHKPGEDVRPGAVILTAGRRLKPQDIGLAALTGRTRVTVYRRLRVALFSIGEGVREPGAPLPRGVVYDANRYMLAALLTRLGSQVSDLGIVPDQSAPVREILSRAAGDHDLILGSGGVALGDEDPIMAVVEAAEGRLHAWRLAIRPGRPVALGQIAARPRPSGVRMAEPGGTVPFIGLPGNPVAVMVTFLLVVRPIVLRLSGAVEPPPRLYAVRADFSHRKRRDRREYLRVTLSDGPDGIPLAQQFPRAGSAILSAMVGADGLVELAEDVTRLERGTIVGFLPFNEVV